MDTKKGHPRRGICLYSYHNLLGKTMTLEDAFLEMYDTGATCFEFMTSYIPNYPNPSTGGSARNTAFSPQSLGTGQRIICTVVRP